MDMDHEDPFSACSHTHSLFSFHSSASSSYTSCINTSDSTSEGTLTVLQALKLDDIMGKRDQTYLAVQLDMSSEHVDNNEYHNDSAVKYFSSGKTR